MSSAPALLSALKQITIPGSADPLSVPGALTLARTHCRRDCFAYHASWRITRLLGLKGNPAWHEGFYRRALTRAGIPDRGKHRPVRVLICAGADETMLAVLTRILPPTQNRHGDQGQAISVHIVDACRTPLVLSTAHAARHRLSVSTTQDLAPDLSTLHGPFDVIVTDGLLSLLPDEAARSATVARLAGLLDQDGAFLYTTRITSPGRALEYDRAGRLLLAAACLAWPHGQRLRLALSAWTRRARPSPFPTRDALQTAIGEHFTDTESFQRATPATLAQRAHPHHWWPGQHASACVGILATHPRRERP